MANVKEENKWEEGVYQIEVTDPVVGGVDGISNKQAKQLANRTKYLKTQVESLLSKLNAAQSALDTKISVSDMQNALDGKLGKTAKAADSDKLDGLDSSAFAKVEHALVKRSLPKGNYTSVGFWRTVEAGWYSYNHDSIQGSNNPSAYGIVHVIKDGDDYNILWYKKGAAEVYRAGFGGSQAENSTIGWNFIATSLTTGNYPDTAVLRDANGDFEARYISAASFKSTTNNDDDRMNFQSCIMYWSPDDRFMRPASLAKSREIIYGTDFVSVKNLNGYTNLPNKLIIQWGTALVASGENQVPTLFPIAFPNKCLSVMATHIGGAKSVNVIVSEGSVTTTGATFKHTWGNSSSTTVSYLAIGY